MLNERYLIALMCLTMMNTAHWITIFQLDVRQVAVQSRYEFVSFIISLAPSDSSVSDYIRPATVVHTEGHPSENKIVLED